MRSSCVSSLKRVDQLTSVGKLIGWTQGVICQFYCYCSKIRCFSAKSLLLLSFLEYITVIAGILGSSNGY